MLGRFCKLEELAESLGHPLSKAARKRELAAAKQLETGALQMAATTGINMAQVQHVPGAM